MTWYSCLGKQNLHITCCSIYTVCIFNFFPQHGCCHWSFIGNKASIHHEFLVLLCHPQFNSCYYVEECTSANLFLCRLCTSWNYFLAHLTGKVFYKVLAVTLFPSHVYTLHKYCKWMLCIQGNMLLTCINNPLSCIIAWMSSYIT